MLLVRIWSLLFRIFYKDLEVEGLENVPKDKPILFVSNHTNAILDPFCIMVALQRRVMITARSTLVRFPFFGMIMKSIGVITFDRSQDKVRNRDRNHNMQSIQKCSDAIHHKKPVCIFPEGQSHSDPKLRPFKNGAARIAIDYEQRYGQNTPLFIVPVGLFFKEKSTYRSTALVRFNTFIQVDNVMKNNPNPRQITQEIEKGIQQVTLHFNSTAESEKLIWLGELLVNYKGSYPLTKDASNLKQLTKLTRKLQYKYTEFKSNPKVQKLESNVDRLKSAMHKHGIATTDLFVPYSLWRSILFALINTVILLVGFPVFIISTMLHIIQYYLTKLIAKRFTKAQDQWASNMIVIGSFIFPIFYFLYLAILAIMNPKWVLICAIGLPLFGYLSLLYIDRLTFSFRRSLAFCKLNLNPRLRAELTDSATHIIKDINQLKEVLRV